MCVHGAHDCPGYPGQSAQSDGHVRRQHDVIENALYIISPTLLLAGCGHCCVLPGHGSGEGPGACGDLPLHLPLQHAELLSQQQEAGRGRQDRGHHHV